MSHIYCWCQNAAKQYNLPCTCFSTSPSLFFISCFISVTWNALGTKKHHELTDPYMVPSMTDVLTWKTAQPLSPAPPQTLLYQLYTKSNLTWPTAHWRMIAVAGLYVVWMSRCNPLHAIVHVCYSRKSWTWHILQDIILHEKLAWTAQAPPSTPCTLHPLKLIRGVFLPVSSADTFKTYGLLYKHIQDVWVAIQQREWRSLTVCKQQHSYNSCTGKIEYA